MSLPAGEEVDLGGTLPSGTTNKGGNDTPDDRARSVSPTTANEDAAADEEHDAHGENTLSLPSLHCH